MHVPHSLRGPVWAYSSIDSQTKRLLVPQGFAENEQLILKVLVGTLTGSGLTNLTEATHVTAREALIGDAGTNVKMNEPGRRHALGLGSGILNGPEAYIPFAFSAKTYSGVNNVSDGPFASGVFRSKDSGKTWETEKIVGFDSGAPSLVLTENHLNCVGVQHPIPQHGLWFSRKPASGGSWEKPRLLTKSFSNVYGRFAVAGEADTAHVCWMDKRNNKWRFNISGPPIENNEIYYRRRKDSDTDWNMEVLLSKGLLYAYAPTISAEGDNVVVVWAGIGNADKNHTYLQPNDIFYVTSSDGGATWSDPMKVTDSAKDGIVSGMPQVALLNGTIHLLYTQGANQAAQELSPGLRKLGSGPWPIYYTRREFPK